MNKVTDIDGNEAVMNDQGEVLDASHSQNDTSATETTESPGAPADKTLEATPVEDWKAKYETSQKDYDRLNKEFTKRSQRNSDLEKSIQQYEPYKDKLESWQKSDQLLQKDPVAYKYLEARLQGYSHEAAQSFSDQGTQQSNQHINELAQRTAEHEKFIRQFQQAQGQHQAATHLDTQEKAANDVFKTYFGKDMSESDKHALYSFMTENQFYNGAVVARSLFAEQYAEAKAQKVLEDQKSKGSKMIQRTPTKNSAAAKSPSKGNMTFREAWEASLAEHKEQGQ